jgi:hypothetical protein
VQPQARPGAIASLLGELLGCIRAQDRAIDAERIVPALIRLGILGPRALRPESARVHRGIDALEPVDGLRAVRAQGACALEGGARLLEAPCAERRKTLAGGLGIAVLAEGGLGCGGYRRGRGRRYGPRLHHRRAAACAGVASGCSASSRARAWLAVRARPSVRCRQL